MRNLKVKIFIASLKLFNISFFNNCFLCINNSREKEIKVLEDSSPLIKEKKYLY